MRKKSGSNMQDLSFSAINNLSKLQKGELQNYFKKTDQRSGGISFYDLIIILNSIGYEIDEEKKKKLNKEITQKEIKIIDLPILYFAAGLLKKQKEENSNNQQHEDNQYIDAFVALGGNHDSTGFVTKSTLIKTLKNQFQLNFDIESLVDGLEGFDNQKLDFKQFCQLFEQDKKSIQRKSSVLSLLSQKTLHNSDSMKTLVVNEKDFEKYLAKIEGHELHSP